MKPQFTKPKTARAVHPNAGVTARYRRQMQALVDEMSTSVEYWMKATYRDSPPAVASLVTGDASPSRAVNKQLRELAKRWLKRFDEAAPRIAEAYVKAQFAASNSAMMSSLREAGFAVKFEMTPAMRDAFDATLSENIGLIKSIPEKYLTQVEGVVNRAYASGRDLQSMVAGIRKLYPEASNRAVLIARDQSNKANSVVNRTRQLELGITEAIWMHSHAGKTPRPDHVAADRKTFKVAEGFYMKTEGKWVQPGEEINCRCTSRPVIPGFAA